MLLVAGLAGLVAWAIARQRQTLRNAMLTGLMVFVATVTLLILMSVAVTVESGGTVGPAR